MKKSELKNGMVVQYRNTSYSKYALVVDNLLIDLNGFMLLNDYNEDLTYSDIKDFDIVAVYKVDGFGCSLLDILNGKYLKIL